MRYAAALQCARWAIATGVLQIVAAIRLRKEIENEWLLIASSVLSVVSPRRICLHWSGARYSNTNGRGIRAQPKEGARVLAPCTRSRGMGSLATLNDAHLA